MSERSRLVANCYYARKNANGKPHIHAFGGEWFVQSRHYLGIGKTLIEAWAVFQEMEHGLK